MDLNKLDKFFVEFIVFALKQVRACIFAGSFFALLFISKYITTFGLPQYDFLFISVLILQGIFLATKLESVKELKVIIVFHIIGLILELFKTSPYINSWGYPQEAFFKIGTVPLYSGFMYSAVASYVIQSFRIFDLKLKEYPNYLITIVLSIAIYLNYFTKHFIYDFRWVLILLVALAFLRTKVFYTVIKKRRSMPLVTSFGLIACFLWVAENIETFLGAWKYSYQVNVWDVVHIDRIISWFLLFEISFIIVVYLKYKHSKN